MLGLFGQRRTTPREAGCLGAIVYVALFAGAMIGTLWLIVWQLDLRP